MERIFLIYEESENNERIKKKRLCMRKEGNYDKNADVNTATQ